MSDLVGLLDANLSLYGETIRLLRMAKPPATGIAKEVTCMAVIRGYAPTELSPGSGINQQDQRLILSPTPLIAAGWPGPGLKALPLEGDRIVSNRGALTIQAAVGIYVKNELVRIECQVRGQ